MIEALCCKKVCNWVLSASKCTLSDHSLSCVFNVVLVNVGSSSVEVGSCVIFWMAHNWGMVTQISCAPFPFSLLPKFHILFTLCFLCKRSGICFELPVQMIRNAACPQHRLVKCMPFGTLAVRSPKDEVNDMVNESEINIYSYTF